MDSCVSRRSKCQPSQENGKVTGLTWASFLRNNSPLPTFSSSFLSGGEVLNVTVHPPAPKPPPPNSSPRPTQPPTFPLHMLMLRAHSFCWWLCHRGEGKRQHALRDSCMHFSKLTPRRPPDSSSFYSVLLFHSPFSHHFCPQTSHWIKSERKTCLFF